MCAERIWNNGAKWHEEKVFSYLTDSLPREYKLLTNRVLLKPNSDYSKEFDLILLGKYAVYIVEVKHVIGQKISGDAENWYYDAYGQLEPYKLYSPIKQLREQLFVLLEKMRQAGLGEIALVEGVCIYREQKPIIDIRDADENLKKIFWYRELDKFILNYLSIPENLRKQYGINEKTDISSFHDRLRALIDSNFTSRKLGKIGNYEIEDEAWRTSRYVAYYAHLDEQTRIPEKVLLKEYRIPDAFKKQKINPQRKTEIHTFIQRLNGRAESASNMLQKQDDSRTRGKKYVLANQNAFQINDETYVVVSDWVEGQPLSYFLRDKLTAKYLPTIASQICRGMAFVHDAGVYHRNISLDNIIWSDSEHEIRIINFYFSRLVGKKTILIDPQIVNNFNAEMIEKHYYQAPELKANSALSKTQQESLYHDANAKTDIYSLGVVLLELFSGISSGSETVKDRLKELGHLSENIKNVIRTYCSDLPDDRTKIPLMDAARIFEESAGNVLPTQDLFNLKDGDALGFYKVVRTLETTDLSVVYLADYVLSPDNQKVVIKIHKPKSQGNTIRRELWDSIQIIKEIDNQFTARLIQTDKAFVYDGKVFLQNVQGAQEAYYQIWEYIEGKDLGEYLESTEPFSLEGAGWNDLEERFLICLGVLRSLSALHEKDWVHRDTKPKNFMRTPDGQIKIIDFGLSRRSDDSQLIVGGTPCYIPPEAYSHDQWMKPGDVWAVGCMITYILTGTEICKTTDVDQAINSLDGISKLGEDIVKVLKKATNNSPDNRYPSAVEFLSEFEKAHKLLMSGKQERPNMQSKNILIKMKAKREEAELTGDLNAVDRITTDIHTYESWDKAGQIGDCPVNLEIYGLHPKGETPFLVQETPQIVTVQTPPAKEPTPMHQTVEEVSDQSTGDVNIDDVAIESADRVQETLRLELEKVRGYMEKQEWREAVALAKSVEERARGALKESARSVLDQVQAGLNTALKTLLEQGNQSRSKKDADAARKAYQAVLNLDQSNSDARLALMELDGLVKKQVSAQKLNELRSGLAERRDIRRLGGAVYDAEALEQEGKLPDELIKPLELARALYDKRRLEMGEITTAMHGDLRLRAYAVGELQKRVAKGEKYVYDAATNTEKPSFELLREAQVLVQQASEDMAQYELNIAEKNKALRPRWVHLRLVKALEDPFYEQDKRKLEEKLAEVDRFVQSLEQAEVLQEKAQQEGGQVQKLSLLLQAREIFPVLTGLSEQISQVRPVAISVTQTTISDMLRLAESRLQSQEYTEARKTTADAEKEASNWPEAQKPEEIVQFLDSARSVRQQIDATEIAWKEYFILAKDIRQKVVDQDQRVSGLALFKQVSEDERFRNFPDLRALTSEIDQYKGVGEQLNDALSARTGGDWSRVFEIAEKVVKSGTAGKLTPRFHELYADAVTELNVNRAQELLASDDIFEANSILSATLNKEKERSPERASNLETRLAVELERIQQARNGTNKGMQDLYDQACNLLDFSSENIGFEVYTKPSYAVRQTRARADGSVGRSDMCAFINRLKDSSEEEDPTPDELMERTGHLLLEALSRKGIAERSKAIKLFRYVGRVEKTGEADWPSYALSFRTAEARRAARLVADSLRQDVLEPLKQKRNTYQGREKELGDSLLGEMAQQAAVLRETSLLETEDERSVGRWVEVQWGRQQALYEEKQVNWSGASEIWCRLDINHPGVPDVKRGLLNARIQHTIGQARYLMENDHKGEDALALLRDLQKEPEMDNAWELNEALAEAHAFMGQFDSAFGNLDQSARIVGGMEDDQRRDIAVRLQAKREEIESQRVIYHCYNDAKNKDASGNTAEALRVLQAGIKNPTVKNDKSLRQLRDEIFARASAELLQKAQEERKKGTDDSKVLAVTALVDLQTLEELIEQPVASRRSGEELNRLRADLAPAAEAVTREALDFDPAALPLEQAIGQASSLSARLQTFDTVIPLFTAELEQVKEKLKKRRSDMTAALKNLQTLDTTLRQATNQSIWESAVRTGDFLVLEQYQSTIRKLELNTLPDVRAYEKRLDETQEVYRNILRIVGDVKKKFSQEEDFAAVKKLLVEGSVQALYRANEEAWQSVHSREYEDIRRLLDDRLRVPDIYGDSDLVGWQIVSDQSEIRARELELWENWDKQCEYKMETASQAVKQAESQGDLGTRLRKSNWEKARDATRAALELVAYFEKAGEETDAAISSTVLMVGARDARNEAVPSRSQKSRALLKEGKRRKGILDEWLHNAENQVSLLDGELDRHGFPTAQEFNDATSQKDWDRLEKLLILAREAGITNEEEHKRVATFARVLEEQRKKKKKDWWPL